MRNIDILMILEARFDSSFPTGEFLINGYIELLRIDWNSQVSVSTFNFMNIMGFMDSRLTELWVIYGFFKECVLKIWVIYDIKLCCRDGNKTKTVFSTNGHDKRI